ncbi:hypothetical protein MFERI13461_00593 [Mycoplasma feriruminatoris]|uniref:hypothetical protein n=1 Tax=Mycoplasma feriruminatoris TaxID=1179777 RepID=UPI00241D4870|nr:hypothetical protein [Mycoplasma feriruminatoris]WFQ91156.1 hypothetical protein MFERI13461_00593 [Mycoplasma feriruminatoris]
MFLALLASMNLTNIEHNLQPYNRIQNFRSEFNAIEQINLNKTIIASDNPNTNSDHNFYVCRNSANFYNESVKSHIFKGFNFKLSDEYISFIKDGLKLEISLTINLEFINNKDEIFNNKYDLVFYLSNNSFTNQSSKDVVWKNVRYQNKDKTITDYIDTRNHWEFTFNNHSYWFDIKHVFNKKHNFRFTDFKSLNSFHSLKYSIDKLKYRFYTPISLYEPIKNLNFNINKDDVSIDDIKKQIYLQQTNLKNSEFYKKNKVLWDGLYDNLKLEIQEEKKFKRFVWDDKINVKISLPVKQKYKKYLKDIYFIANYNKKYDLNWLIEIDELEINKTDLKNISRHFGDLNLLFLTAFDTEIEDNILTIKPKKEYEHKFYNQKQVVLKFKDKNTDLTNSNNNSSSNNQINSSTINQNQQIQSQNNTTNQINNSITNNLIYKNPYLYISIAIGSIFLICLLFLLNKIMIKRLNKQRKSS